MKHIVNLATGIGFFVLLAAFVVVVELLTASIAGQTILAVIGIAFLLALAWGIGWSVRENMREG